MSLTGRPLILLAAVSTVVVLGATVVGWRRSGRFRFVVRPIGLLLTELLVLTTAGLWFNRAQQFYPTWSALLDDTEADQVATAPPVGRLDAWLAGRTPARADQPVTFAWQPAGWTRWGLARAPSITVPAGYRTHPASRYPVVLILAGPDPAADLRIRDVVLVSAPITATTPADVLGTSLPASLERDLRVTAVRWALVAPTARAATATAAIASAPRTIPRRGVPRSGRRAADARRSGGAPGDHPGRRDRLGRRTDATTDGPPRRVTCLRTASPLSCWRAASRWPPPARSACSAIPRDAGATSSTGASFSCSA